MSIRLIVISLLLSIYSAAFAAKPLQVKKYPDRTMGYLQLANGLDVLLVSSPGYQKDSVVMGVPAGALSDPLEHQGMAHFLEHMVFLSSKDYPVGEYQQYIDGNGGQHNAYTTLESTRYFFSLNPSAFEGGLQRFAQFFISPNFNPEYVEREKIAVNNEFKIYMQNESRRLWGVLSGSAAENSPYRRFMVGSTETLKNTRREDLIAFYEKYYSANTMKLVLMSSRPIAELERLARSYFSEVPNRKLTKPDYRSGVGYLVGGQWLNVKAVTQTNSLTISFITPSPEKAWRTKPEKLISVALGDESAGSVVAKLKNENLIVDQSVDTDDMASGGSFSINYTLTSEGAKRVDYVIQQTFAQVNLLKASGIPAHIFSELKTLSAQAFENRMLEEEGETLPNISQLFLNVKGSPLSLEEDHQIAKSQPTAAEVKQWLQSLRPERAQIIFLSPEAPTDSVEKHFGVEYSKRMVTPQELSDWANAQSPDLRLSKPNKYIARDFRLYKDSPTDEARKLVDDARGALWFAQEKRSMTTPRGYVQVEYIHPDAAANPRQMLLAAMLAEVLEMGQNEAIFPARSASYALDISSTATGFKAQISGFSERVLDVAYDLLTYQGGSLARSPINDVRFAALKERMRQEFANRQQKDAAEIVVENMRSLTRTPFYLKDDAVKELESITADELRAFAKSMFSSGYFETLVYGNVQEAAAKKFFEKLRDTTDAQEVSRERLASVALRMQRPAAGQYFEKTVQGKNNNNAFMSGYFINEGLKRDEVLIELVVKLFAAPFYTEMRSNQGLGYAVQAFPYSLPGLSGLGMLIQSSDYESAELARRAHQFASTDSKRLAQIGAEEFLKVKASLREEWQQESSNMTDEYKSLQEYLAKGKDFRRKEKMLAALEEVTVEDFRQFVAKLFDSKQHGRLTVFYNGELKKK